MTRLNKCFTNERMEGGDIMEDKKIKKEDVQVPEKDEKETTLNEELEIDKGKANDESCVHVHL